MLKGYGFYDSKSSRRTQLLRDLMHCGLHDTKKNNKKKRGKARSLLLHGSAGPPRQSTTKLAV
jgi:hypothetical protein